MSAAPMCCTRSTVGRVPTASKHTCPCRVGEVGWAAWWAGGATSCGCSLLLEVHFQGLLCKTYLWAVRVCCDAVACFCDCVLAVNRGPRGSRGVGRGRGRCTGTRRNTARAKLNDADRSP
eukprot:1358206-Prymnesium_polylepis.2